MRMLILIKIKIVNIIESIKLNRLKIIIQIQHLPLNVYNIKEGIVSRILVVDKSTQNQQNMKHKNQNLKNKIIKNKKITVIITKINQMKNMTKRITKMVR